MESGLPATEQRTDKPPKTNIVNGYANENNTNASEGASTDENNSLQNAIPDKRHTAFQNSNILKMKEEASLAAASILPAICTVLADDNIALRISSETVEVVRSSSLRRYDGFTGDFLGEEMISDGCAQSTEVRGTKRGNSEISGLSNQIATPNAPQSSISSINSSKPTSKTVATLCGEYRYEVKNGSICKSHIDESASSAAVTELPAKSATPTLIVARPPSSLSDEAVAVAMADNSLFIWTPTFTHIYRWHDAPIKEMILLEDAVITATSSRIARLSLWRHETRILHSLFGDFKALTLGAPADLAPQSALAAAMDAPIATPLLFTLTSHSLTAYDLVTDTVKFTELLLPFRGSQLRVLAITEEESCNDIFKIKRVTREEIQDSLQEHSQWRVGSLMEASLKQQETDSSRNDGLPCSALLTQNVLFYLNGRGEIVRQFVLPFREAFLSETSVVCVERRKKRMVLRAYTLLEDRLVLSAMREAERCAATDIQWVVNENGESGEFYVVREDVSGMLAHRYGRTNGLGGTAVPRPTNVSSESSQASCAACLALYRLKEGGIFEQVAGGCSSYHSCAGRMVGVRGSGHRYKVSNGRLYWVGGSTIRNLPLRDQPQVIDLGKVAGALPSPSILDFTEYQGAQLVLERRGDTTVVAGGSETVGVPSAVTSVHSPHICSSSTAHLQY